MDFGVEKRGTYKGTCLSASAGKDQDGLGAGARASVLKLAGAALTSNKSLDLSVGRLGNCNWGGSGQSGEEWDGEELHREDWWLGD